MSPRRASTQPVVVGERFGRWVVLSYVGKSKARQLYWFCACDCGARRKVLAMTLRNGESRSCGCLNRELSAERAANLNLRHGHARRGRTSPEYCVWRNMWQRCQNPRNTSFTDYGGRGIAVCERWQSSRPS